MGGYELDSNVTGSEGSWKVPTVMAPAITDMPAYSSQWTGIGGSFNGITNGMGALYKALLANGAASGNIPVTNNLLSELTDLSGSSFNINWYNYY